MEQFATLLAKPRRGLPETVAERYRIGREIGTGGMATVYLARDLSTTVTSRSRSSALISPPSSELSGSSPKCGSRRSWTIRTFSHSSTRQRRRHPLLCTAVRAGRELRAKLEREPQLSLEDALSITRQVAAALDYAHTQGVVHRDVKPENILLHEGEAVLADSASRSP
jgi:serine/threonine-protein kinase